MFEKMMSISIKKAFIYLLVAVVLGTIFTAYFAPETMVAITNQVWAMCGW
jgi:hypothetical protein